MVFSQGVEGGDDALLLRLERRADLRDGIAHSRTVSNRQMKSRSEKALHEIEA